MTRLPKYSRRNIPITSIFNVVIRLPSWWPVFLFLFRQSVPLTSSGKCKEHNKEIPLEIEEEYNPPFNSIIAPVKEELTKLNRSLKLNTEVALVKIATSKNRILKLLRCGLSSCNNYTDIESYSNPKNFRDIFFE